MIFDDSNQLLSLINPHLDTPDTKIGPKTPKLGPKSFFKAWISVTLVLRPIFVSEVSRWGFLSTISGTRVKIVKLREF